MDAPGALSGFLDDAEHRRKRRRLDCQLDVPSKDSLPARSSEDEEDAARLAKLPDAKKRKAQAYSLAVYKPELETIQRDYSQAHVNSLRRPANFVLGAAPEHRFDECARRALMAPRHWTDLTARYPKLRRLLDLHSAVVAECAHPATRLTTDLRAFDLPSLLPVRYDAILIGPPRTNGIAWTWTDLEALPIPTIAANPSFIWLWVGQGCEDGLERGRALLSKWGYRCVVRYLIRRCLMLCSRCEDIVWLKTNKRGAATDVTPPETLFANTKEHCLMGIRGTVRRSNDAHFIHCNGAWPAYG
jgi:mRNA (2'-O-methyladenosine-N6-)-methyltransferase